VTERRLELAGMVIVIGARRAEPETPSRRVYLSPEQQAQFRREENAEIERRLRAFAAPHPKRTGSVVEFSLPRKSV
jgi:hypothetical protein